MDDCSLFFERGESEALREIWIEPVIIRSSPVARAIYFLRWSGKVIFTAIERVVVKSAYWLRPQSLAPPWQKVGE